MRRREWALAGLAAGFSPWALAKPGLAGPLMAFTEHLPPLNFQDAAGQPAGFSSELLQLMAAQAQLSLDIQVQPWRRAVQAAAAQNNSILFSLTRLPERERQYRWVGPISERRIMVYGLRQREDLPELKQVSDLRRLQQGMKVGVVRESAAARRLQEEGLLAGETLELALDDGSNLRKLLARRMDLMVMLDWAAAWQLHQLRLDYRTLRPLLVLDARRSYWYGLHPDSDDRVVLALQAALDQLRRDGRYSRLRQRYFS